MSLQLEPSPKRTLRRALDALFREARELERRRRRRYALVALVVAAGAIAVAYSAGGGGTGAALARSAPREPLPRLGGPVLTGPTRLRIAVAENHDNGREGRRLILHLLIHNI
jgi:hypothetical protein